MTSGSIQGAIAIRRAHVFVEMPGEGFIPCGVLRMDAEAARVRSCSFRYVEGFLRREDAFSIDPVSLPLTTSSDGPWPAIDILSEAGDVMGAIRDASPDGHGRAVLDRAFGATPLTEFDYIVRSGSHRVGALAFGFDTGDWMPPGESVLEETNLDEIVAARDVFEEEGRVSSREALDYVDRASSLGGMRPKAAVMLGGRQWLAKFLKSMDTYDCIRTEFATAALARSAGLDMPEIRLESVGDRKVFLIERFDRTIDDEGRVAARVPFASALSMTGETETTARYGSYEAIAEAIRRHGLDVASDLRELYRRAVFNVLVSNDDDHLRNHGFLYDHDRKGWKLSPLYDVSPRPALSLDRNLAISFLKDQDLRGATIENVLAVSDRFGIRREEAEAIVDDLACFVQENWEGHLRDSGLSTPEIERMASCFVRATEHRCFAASFVR